MGLVKEIYRFLFAHQNGPNLAPEMGLICCRNAAQFAVQLPPIWPQSSFISFFVYFFLCLSEHAKGPLGPFACEPSTCNCHEVAIACACASAFAEGKCTCTVCICKGPLGPLQMLVHASGPLGPLACCMCIWPLRAKCTCFKHVHFAFGKMHVQYACNLPWRANCMHTVCVQLPLRGNCTHCTCILPSAKCTCLMHVQFAFGKLHMLGVHAICLRQIACTLGSHMQFAFGKLHVLTSNK